MNLYDEHGKRLLTADDVRAAIEAAIGAPISDNQWFHWSKPGGPTNAPESLRLLAAGSVGRSLLFHEDEVQRFMERLIGNLRIENGQVTLKRHKKQHRALAPSPEARQRDDAARGVK